jgi:hypothetical protein
VIALWRWIRHTGEKNESLDAFIVGSLVRLHKTYQLDCSTNRINKIMMDIQPKPLTNNNTTINQAETVTSETRLIHYTLTGQLMLEFKLVDGEDEKWTNYYTLTSPESDSVQNRG